MKANLPALIVAAALGAAAMYAFDPDKGRRRRALGRDKVRSYVGRARSFATAAARDVDHRLQVVRARMRRRLAAASATDDLMLIERARAAMGRVVSHPHAVQIGAKGGRLILSGPILADEAPLLVAAMHRVPGVMEVEDRLAVHAHPESVPALQGGGAPRASNDAWTPAGRAAAMLGGALLALSGARNRSLTGLTLVAIGVALTARGATNRPVGRVVKTHTPAERADVGDTSQEPRAAS